MLWTAERMGEEPMALQLDAAVAVHGRMSIGERCAVQQIWRQRRRSLTLDERDRIGCSLLSVGARIGKSTGGAMEDTGAIAQDQRAEADDDRESCGLDFAEEPVADEEILFVVLSPDGDPARIQEYHRLAVEGG